MPINKLGVGWGGGLYPPYTVHHIEVVSSATIYKMIPYRVQHKVQCFLQEEYVRWLFSVWSARVWPRLAAILFVCLLCDRPCITITCNVDLDYDE